jgi:ribosomal protein L16 Arg81 hydroxylase
MVSDESVEEFLKEFKNYRPTSQFFPPNKQVDVEGLRVRLPQNSAWVRVEKCQYIQQNNTLDTRLQFPDLQISGRVSMPGNSHCNMILR